MSNTLNGVEIFSTATAVPSVPGWPIKLDEGELQDIANNFRALQAKIRPQLKLGHDEKDGMPAFGKVANVYVQANKLLADFADIPDVVYKAIEAGLYKQVSVELAYSQEVGWYLTAVSLLGADLPAMQNLQDLQAYLTANGGSPAGSAPPTDLHATFSIAEPKFHKEVKKMTTEQEQELERLRAENATLKAKQDDKKDSATAAELAALKAERDALKASQKKAAFSAARDKALAPFEDMVKAKTLEPGLRDKIREALEAQEAKFSAADGEELALPTSLLLEIQASMKPTGDQAKGSPHDDGTPPDAAFTAKVYEVMASSGKSFEESSRLAAAANPHLVKAWFGFTQEIHMKGVN